MLPLSVEEARIFIILDVDQDNDFISYYRQVTIPSKISVRIRNRLQQDWWCGSGSKVLLQSETLVPRIVTLVPRIVTNK